MSVSIGMSVYVLEVVLAGTAFTMAALAVVAVTVLAVWPDRVRRMAEWVWATAWAVEAGGREYHTRRRDASQGQIDTRDGGGQPYKVEGL